MTTCILLAGGLGTRLRESVPGVPKCLAPVGSTTFLQIQMGLLASQGVRRFILSLGYRADQVIEVARSLKGTFSIEWVVEPRPLGTGGASLLAMDRAALAEVIIANADTILEADLSALLLPLDVRGAEHIRMVAVPSPEDARFGGVLVRSGKVEQYLSSGTPYSGLVNAGMYRVHRDAFANFRPGETFSLELDVIQELAKQGRASASIVTGTFVDIGVPRDYQRFCKEFSRPRLCVSQGRRPCH
jgi:D-glycero-alpha-D-manno-heptose 1-phosphate guanylyltransferase